MEWKQIETKWAAMTRRIRADYVCDRIEPSRGSTRDLPRSHALPASIAESKTASAEQPASKTTSK